MDWYPDNQASCLILFKDYIRTNYHDVVDIMKHMASFILNFKKGLEMSLSDIETLLQERADDRALIEFQRKLHVDKLAKEFVKYNMRVSSFDRFI